MADFEREEARGWKGWMENALPSRALKRTARPIVFPTEPESEARASWRRNDEPQGTISLPRNFNPQGQAILKRQVRSTGNVLFDRFPFLKEIALNSDIHIAVSRLRPQDGTLCLELWGDENNVRKAKELFNEWLQDYHAVEKRSKWAKTPSLTDDQKAQRDREFAAFAAAQEFRKAPPAGTVFEHTASFRWPTDIGHAEQLLGRSFEALDPIRTDEFCYITYDYAQTIFKILGNKHANVKKALSRLRAVYYQLAAWRIEAPEIYLLVPPDANRQWGIVMLQNEPSESLPDGDTLPKKFPVCMEFEPEDRGLPARELNMLQFLNVRSFKDAIMYTLSKLPYYRGNLTMRARLGRFLLTHYQRQTYYSKEEFLEMMADPQVHGEVTEDYGVKPSSETGHSQIRSHSVDMLHAETKAKKISTTLSPGNKVIEGPAHALTFSVAPSHVVTFVVRKGTEWFRLDIEFQGQSENEVVCTSQKWSRVEPETGKLFHLLDVSLIDVSRGSTAWHFEITAGHPIDDKTTHVLNRFADRVDMHYFKEKPFPQVSYKPVMGLTLEFYQHSIVWRHQFDDCDYVVELSKVEELTRPTLQSDSQPRIHPEARHNMWSICVCAPQWTRNLDQNAHIGVGQRAEWNPAFKSFFPPPKGNFSNERASDGFSGFLEQLALVSDIAHNV